MGFHIELTVAAKDFLAEKGYDPQYGARPLNRAIQKYLEDPIAEELLKGEIAEGDTILADYVKETDAEQISISVRRKETTV
jgi:ATP-dependent Clp protease ATP-binding subunit ClpC